MEGADRWRNPEQDLPADFEDRRGAYYAKLAQPLAADEFIDPLRREMTAELEALQQALPGLAWLKISTRRGGQITLSPLDAAPEPRNLHRLKAQIRTRWGLVPLLDMLKETVLRIGLLEHFAPAGPRTGIDPAVLAERLILCIFGYGTNIGLRAIAAGEHGHTEEPARSPPRPPTRRSPRAGKSSGAPAPVRWPRTRPISGRSIRTCSPSTTSVTAGGGC